MSANDRLNNGHRRVYTVGPEPFSVGLENGRAAWWHRVVFRPGQRAGIIKMEGACRSEGCAAGSAEEGCSCQNLNKLPHINRIGKHLFEGRVVRRDLLYILFLEHVGGNIIYR